MADRMGGVWQGATIPSGTPVVIPMNGAPLPCTITLKSSAAGRLIELSTDGGTEYFTLAPDNASATLLAGAIKAPVSHVRVTGAADDTWRIQ
jgi:hypothetical protein